MHLCNLYTHVPDNIQSILVISKSKGHSEILRDIRTSTYQIAELRKKYIEQPRFTNEYVI